MCEVCERAKHSKESYRIESSIHKDAPFNLMGCDVWGPTPSSQINEFQWFQYVQLKHIKDPLNRFNWIFLLKSKSEVAKKLKTLSQMIEQ